MRVLQLRCDVDLITVRLLTDHNSCTVAVRIAATATSVVVVGPRRRRITPLVSLHRRFIAAATTDRLDLCDAAAITMTYERVGVSTRRVFATAQAIFCCDEKM